MRVPGCAALLLLASCALDHPRSVGGPRVMLWAWEAPQSLSFIDPAEVGVAFLARTLVLGPGTLEVRPRLQPLRVPPHTTLAAVVRVEAHGVPGPADLARAADAVAAAALPGVSRVQVDFEARASQRATWQALLAEVRRRLPRGVPLSATTLASWCAAPRVIGALPVDEVVPMLMRMGPDDRALRDALARGSDLPCAACRAAAGVALDELALPLPSPRRVYVFQRGPWTPATVREALRRARGRT